MSQGPEALGGAELLAILLRTGLPGKSAVELAADILASREGLGGLARITPQKLKKSLRDWVWRNRARWRRRSN
jgi:DNA repair protein RadC